MRKALKYQKAHPADEHGATYGSAAAAQALELLQQSAAGNRGRGPSQAGQEGWKEKTKKDHSKYVGYQLCLCLCLYLGTNPARQPFANLRLSINAHASPFLTLHKQLKGRLHALPCSCHTCTLLRTRSVTCMCHSGFLKVEEAQPQSGA